MTIAEAINGYDNGKLVIDKLVYQFASEQGSRVIFCFVVDSEGLYLRKDEIIGFGEMNTEDIPLNDEDVQETLPEYIASFFDVKKKIYDIYQKDVAIPAIDLLKLEFLQEHDLVDTVFFSYQS